jgi:hypothetical protein
MADETIAQSATHGAEIEKGIKEFITIVAQKISPETANVIGIILGVSIAIVFLGPIIKVFFSKTENQHEKTNFISEESDSVEKLKQERLLILEKLNNVEDENNQLKLNPVYSVAENILFITVGVIGASFIFLTAIGFLVQNQIPWAAIKQIIESSGKGAISQWRAAFVEANLAALYSTVLVTLILSIIASITIAGLMSLLGVIHGRSTKRISISFLVSLLVSTIFFGVLYLSISK